MAKAVIASLEAIEVDPQQPDHARGPVQARQCVLGAIAHQGAIGESGSGVGERQTVELGALKVLLDQVQHVHHKIVGLIAD